VLSVECIGREKKDDTGDGCELGGDGWSCGGILDGFKPGIVGYRRPKSSSDGLLEGWNGGMMPSAR
jgi:hypothetical protein